MSPVVMECIVRVCASPRRFERFAEYAKRVANSTFSASVDFSVVDQESSSTLLRHQWDYDNDSLDLPEPVTRELCFAYAGPAGRLTPAGLDSASRDILAGLSPHLSEESVPWILQLTTDPDRGALADIARRHPTLKVTPKIPALVA